MIVVAAVLAACSSSGLSNDAWIWCKEHPAEVDAAATNLGVATAERTFKEPTWWQAYLGMIANQNNAELTASADFATSCQAAQVKASVDPGNVAWCMSDGIGETWDAAVSLSLTTDVDLTTFAYRAMPLQQRINNADWDHACTAAHPA